MMRIFYSPDSEPMILDSIENLNKTFSVLKEFLESKDEQYKIAAITSGNPEPYVKFLPYIEFMKINGAKISINFSGNQGITVKGDKRLLLKYIESFKFDHDENTCHHHPELSFKISEYFQSNDISPFIEADNEYVNENG
jgi:c-di-GMP-related signal transduction protein